ncbi:group II truncated hemoglobin [Phenylobacterium sp.]|uniref:group II truncated hemoglobin n=1 Tax=Phenylobacterium sp. TaxID=1871053 RepID=UPI0035B0B06B
MSDVDAEATPFHRIGEQPAIRRLVDRFYDLMETDPAYAELRAMHAPDLAPMRGSLAGFLTGWLGGPRDWFEANRGVCMMSLHARVGVSAATARQWREAMARALADTGVDRGLAAQINAAFARMSQNMQRD